MYTHHSKTLTIVAILTSVFAAIAAGLLLLGRTAFSASSSAPDWRGSDTQPASQSGWGEPVTSITATYAIYKKDFVYGATSFATTDVRDDSGGKIYSDKESYDIRALTVYRAYDGQTLLDHQPVVFFVHGGSWTDGYRDWYEFVARSFTGERGWITVVIDYRLTSDEVFIADPYCPDRTTCQLPANESYRTKSAWYPDDIDDVAAAFQWTVDHIAENGGNANQIIVFGHSAGAHLASLMATSTYPDHQAVSKMAIKGLVSMSGAYELNSFTHAFWDDAIAQTFHGGFDSPELLDQASPATYVVSDTVLPPFYLLYAEDDLINLTAQNLAFKNKLEAFGYDVTISYLAGYGHYSEMEAIADIGETPTASIVNWIEELLQTGTYLPWVVR